jgi:hypothetical protein
MKKTFNSFDDLDFLKDKSILFKNLSKYNIETISNLLLLGNTGSGRLTRIRLFLSELFKTNKLNINKKHIEFNNKDKTLFYFYKSNYHFEIDMKLCCNIHESDIYEFFLKNYIETKNIIFNIPNIFIFRYAELISSKFQNILSNIIDKYYQTAKFIFISTKKFNKSLSSRIMQISMGNIKKDEIKNFLIKDSLDKNICIKEEDIDNIIDTIYKNNQYYNLNDIFFLYELSIVNGKYEHFYVSHNIFIDDLINIIFTNNFIYNDLYKIKNKLYDLYTCNYSCKNIINYIYKYISNKYNTNLCFLIEFTKLTAEINKSLINCNKHVIHLEKYIIGIIKLKKHIKTHQTFL